MRPEILLSPMLMQSQGLNKYTLYEVSLKTQGAEYLISLGHPPGYPPQNYRYHQQPKRDAVQHRGKP